MAIPRRFLRASGTRAATAASHRLTKSDPTEPTSGLSPAAIRLLMPRMYASAATTYCSREKRSVTFTGTPAKMASSMAGQPSLVPGILISRFGRPARACRLLAAARVLGRVVGEKRRHLQRHPSVHTVRAVPDGAEEIGGPGQILQGRLEEEGLPDLPFRALCGSRRRTPSLLDGLVENGGVGGETGDGELVDISLERAVALRMSRVMLSSQRLWPRSWMSWVAFIASPPNELGSPTARRRPEEANGTPIAQQSRALFMGRLIRAALRGACRSRGESRAGSVGS